jgi:hypothetical protein
MKQCIKERCISTQAKWPLLQSAAEAQINRHAMHAPPAQYSSLAGRMDTGGTHALIRKEREKGEDSSQDIQTHTSPYNERRQVSWRETSWSENIIFKTTTQTSGKDLCTPGRQATKFVERQDTDMCACRIKQFEHTQPKPPGKGAAPPARPGGGCALLRAWWARRSAAAARTGRGPACCNGVRWRPDPKVSASAAPAPSGR